YDLTRSSKLTNPKGGSGQVLTPGSCRSRGFDVDALLRVAQRATAPLGAYREDLGEDRERRLLLGVGADVEPAGAHDPLEGLLRHTCLEKPLPPALLVAARAERPDVEGLALESRHQGGLVELVVVGQNDDRGLMVGRDLAERILGHALPRPLARLEHEHLPSYAVSFDDSEENPALTRSGELGEPVEQIQSTRSTKTSISPPHGSPTDHARSSVIPYVSSLGSPFCRTSCAFS